MADYALRTNLAAHAAATAVVTAAQATFDAALTAYSSGVGSITDLTNSGTLLLRAKITAIAAYAAALSSATVLALATVALGLAPDHAAQGLP